MKKQSNNTSTKTRKTVITLVVLGALVAVTAVACGHHGGHMSPKAMRRVVLGHVDDFLDEIDATDNQRVAFESAAQEILDEGLAMKEAHKECKKEMLALLSQPTVDREAVKAHVQEKIDQLEDFATSAVDRILDAYETLDDAQRQIVIEKLANHMEDH